MNKIIKRILFSVLALALIAEFVFILVLPAVINRQIKSGDAAAMLKEKTGLNLSFDEAKIVTYPDFSVKFLSSNLKITSADNKNVLKTSDFDISLRLLPLLFRDLSLKSLEASDFELLFSRQKDNKIYLGNYALNIKFDTEQEFHPDIDSLNISDADITFDDVLINQKTNLKIKSADFLFF